MKAGATAPPSAVWPRWGKKTVLLVDVNSRTRDSRAKIMGTLGVIVHWTAFVPGKLPSVSPDIPHQTMKSNDQLVHGRVIRCSRWMEWEPGPRSNGGC